MFNKEKNLVRNYQISKTFKLAEMSTNLLVVRLMVCYAAQCLDEDHPDAFMYCAMAKRFATEVTNLLIPSSSATWRI